MEKERLDWLKEIGMIEFKEPLKFACSLGKDAYPHTMYYSEEYIKNTPLEKLKEGYMRNFVTRTLN